MGTVMQFYREWLLCGDTDWLRRLWPTARRALEFAWRYWDADRDGVMEGCSTTPTTSSSTAPTR